jgi:transglutaminase-like putative cysteine protease
MSTVTEPVDETTEQSQVLFRLLALTGALVLAVSHLQVLYSVSTVVGDGTGQLLLTVFVVLVAATVLSRYVREGIALWITVLLGFVGTVVYLNSIPGGLTLLTGATGKLVADSVSLLTGFPIMRIQNVDIWITGYTPAPLFLAWYLALRRRYVPSVAVGGAALGVFVLTGDAALKTTLVGTIGGLAAVGFGELERRNGTIAQADVLAVMFALMVLGSTWVPVVPGGSSTPLFLSPGSGQAPGGESPTLEATLTSTSGEMGIYGPIELSPEVRFTVVAEEERYWRAGVYDRFTGSSWIRTGDTRSYQEGALEPPPGKSNLVSQRFEIVKTGSVMPAAAKPVEVGGSAANLALVDDHGALRPSKPLGNGTTYSVTSRVYAGGTERLAAADGEDPPAIRGTYTQVPNGISGAFRERTERIVSNADNRLETAQVIERYLETGKEYSLNTSLPAGNVADAFLLRMNQGYCVYFATTMTMMLRTQDIPARYVVGYTPGQKVSPNEWVVRGLNSHAWVEVYFQDVGWVKFDPTPGGPRQSAEYERVQSARETGNENVDSGGSEDAPLTPEPTETPEIPDANGSNRTPERNRLGAIPAVGLNETINGTITNAEAGGGGGSSLPPLPSPQDAAFGLVLVAGLAAGAHRYGIADGAIQAIRLRWQPRSDPGRDVERAFARLELLLSRTVRDRDPGETAREYATILGSTTDFGTKASRVVTLYERTHYGEGVSRSEADEAVELVDELVDERASWFGEDL